MEEEATMTATHPGPEKMARYAVPVLVTPTTCGPAIEPLFEGATLGRDVHDEGDGMFALSAFEIAHLKRGDEVITLEAAIQREINEGAELVGDRRILWLFSHRNEFTGDDKVVFDQICAKKLHPISATVWVHVGGDRHSRAICALGGECELERVWLAYDAYAHGVVLRRKQK